MRKLHPRRGWRERLAGFVADPESADGYSPPLAS